MTTAAPDRRGIFSTATACTTDTDFITELDNTGIMQVSSEHLFATALPASHVLTLTGGSATADVDWCFVDCALLRVCDLRAVFVAAGNIRFTLYPATATRILMELIVAGGLTVRRYQNEGKLFAAIVDAVGAVRISG